MFQSLGTAIPLTNIVILSITQKRRRLGDVALDAGVRDTDAVERDIASTSKRVNTDGAMDITVLDGDGLKREDGMEVGGSEGSNNVNIPVKLGEQRQQQRQDIFDPNQQEMDSRTSSYSPHLLGSRYPPPPPLLLPPISNCIQ